MKDEGIDHTRRAKGQDEHILEEMKIKTIALVSEILPTPEFQ